jgi:hypothetical protein
MVFVLAGEWNATLSFAGSLWLDCPTGSSLYFSRINL